MAEVKLQGICKAFGNKTVLRNVDLILPPGTVTCVMGPSGAGKTTLLRIVLGLLAPDSGSLTGLEGLRISPVFQENRLLERMDAVSNLRLVNPALTREEARSALEALGLRQGAQPVAEYSGGMKRRVSLLRALLCPGELLVMDEPFKGLDGDTRGMTIAYTKKSLRGRTLLMVTHDPQEAELLQARVMRLPLLGEADG